MTTDNDFDHIGDDGVLIHDNKDATDLTSSAAPEPSRLARALAQISADSARISADTSSIAADSAAASAHSSHKAAVDSHDAAMDAYRAVGYAQDAVDTTHDLVASATYWAQVAETFCFFVLGVLLGFVTGAFVVFLFLLNASIDHQLDSRHPVGSSQSTPRE